MDNRDQQELEAYRDFFRVCDGHAGHEYTKEGLVPVPAAERLHRAELVRERVVVAIGTFPNDSIVESKARELWGLAKYGEERRFEDLDPGMRDRWIVRAKMDLATFSSEAVRRLADATAKSAVGKPLDEIRGEGVANGWISAARIALLIPAKFWDKQFVNQNELGMRRLLSEIEAK